MDLLMNPLMMADAMSRVDSSYTAATRLWSAEEDCDGQRSTFFFDITTPHNNAIVSDMSVVKPDVNWVTVHATECMRAGVHEWSVRIENQGETTDGSGLMLGLVPKAFSRYDSFISQGGGWSLSRAGKLYGHWRRVDSNPIAALSFGTGDVVYFELDFDSSRLTVRVGDRSIVGELAGLSGEVYAAVSLHYRHQHVAFEHHAVKERPPRRTGWFKLNYNNRLTLHLPFTQAHSEYILLQLMRRGVENSLDMDSPLDRLLKARLWIACRVLKNVQLYMENAMRLTQFLPVSTTPKMLREQLNPAMLPSNSSMPLALGCGLEILGVLLDQLDMPTITMTLGLLQEYLDALPLGGISEKEHAKPSALTPTVVATLKQLLSKMWETHGSELALSLMIDVALARASIDDILSVCKILFAQPTGTELPVTPLVRRLLLEPMPTYDWPALVIDDCNRWDIKSRVAAQSASDNAEATTPASLWALTARSPPESDQLVAITSDGLMKMTTAVGGAPTRMEPFPNCVLPSQLLALISSGCSSATHASKVLIASRTLIQKRGVLYVVLDLESGAYTEVTTSALAGLLPDGFNVDSENKADVKLTACDGNVLLLICEDLEVPRRDDRDGYPVVHPRLGRPADASPLLVFKLRPDSGELTPMTCLKHVIPTAAHGHDSATELRKCLLMTKDTTIEFGHWQELVLPTGAVTIEFWMKMISRDDGKPIFSMGDRGTSGEVFVELQSTDNGLCLKAGVRIETRVNSKSIAAMTMFSSDYLNTWVHICVTFDLTWKIFINGCLSAVSPVAPVGTIVEMPRRRMNLGSCFVGYLSEFRLWRGGRSQPDIQRDMFRGLTGDEPGLIKYCRIGEGKGHIIYDTVSHHHGWVSKTAVAGWRLVSDYPFVPNAVLSTIYQKKPILTHLPFSSLHSTYIFTNGQILVVLVPRCDDATVSGKKQGVTFYFDIANDGRLIQNDTIVPNSTDGPVCVSNINSTVWFSSNSENCVGWLPLAGEMLDGHDTFPNDAVSQDTNSTSTTEVPTTRSPTTTDGSPAPSLPTSRTAFASHNDVAVDPEQGKITADVLASRILLLCDGTAAAASLSPITLFQNFCIDVSEACLNNLLKTIGEHYKEVFGPRRSSFLRGRKAPYVVGTCLRLLHLNLRVINRAGLHPTTLNLALGGGGSASHEHEGADGSERSLGSRIFSVLCEIWNDLSLPTLIRNEARRVVHAGIGLFYPTVRDKAAAVLRLSADRGTAPSTSMVLDSLVAALSTTQSAASLVQADSTPEHRQLVLEVIRFLLARSVDEISTDIKRLEATGVMHAGSRSGTQTIHTIQTALLSMTLSPSFDLTSLKASNPLTIPPIGDEAKVPHPLHDVVVSYIVDMTRASQQVLKLVSGLSAEHGRKAEALMAHSIIGMVLTPALGAIPCIAPQHVIDQLLDSLFPLLRDVVSVTKQLELQDSAMGTASVWKLCEAEEAVPDAATNAFVELRVMVTHTAAILSSFLTRSYVNVGCAPTQTSSVLNQINELAESDLFAGGLNEDHDNQNHITRTIALNTGTGKDLYATLRTNRSGNTTAQPITSDASSTKVQDVLRHVFAVAVHMNAPLAHSIRRRLLELESPSRGPARPPTSPTMSGVISIELEQLFRKVQSLDLDIMTHYRDKGEEFLEVCLERCQFLLQFHPAPDPSVHGDVLKSMFADTFSNTPTKKEGSSWKGMFRGWQKVRKLQKLMNLTNGPRSSDDSNLAPLVDFVFHNTLPLNEIRDALKTREQYGRYRAKGIEYVRQLTQICPDMRCEIVGVLLRALHNTHYLAGIRSCGAAVCSAVQHFTYNVLKESLPQLTCDDCPANFKLLLLTFLKSPWKSFDFAFLQHIGTVEQLTKAWTAFTVTSDGQDASRSPSYVSNSSDSLASIAWDAFSALAISCALQTERPQLGTASFQHSCAKFLTQCFSSMCVELKYSIKALPAMSMVTQPDVITHMYKIMALMCTVIKSVPATSSALSACSSMSTVLETLLSLLLTNSVAILASDIPKASMSVIKFALQRLPTDVCDIAPGDVSLLPVDGGTMLTFLLKCITGEYAVTEMEPITHPISILATHALQDLLHSKSNKWRSAVQSFFIHVLEKDTLTPMPGSEIHTWRKVAVLRAIGGFVKMPSVGDHVHSALSGTGSCWDGILQSGYIVEAKYGTSTISIVSDDLGMTSDEKDATLDTIQPSQPTWDDLVVREQSSHSHFLPLADTVRHVIERIVDSLATESPHFDKSVKKTVPLSMLLLSALRALDRFLEEPTLANGLATNPLLQRLAQTLCMANTYTPLPLPLCEAHISVLLPHWIRVPLVAIASPKLSSSDVWTPIETPSSRRTDRRNSALVEHLADIWENDMQNGGSSPDEPPLDEDDNDAREDMELWQEKFRQGPQPDGLHYCLMFMDSTGAVDLGEHEVVLDPSRGFSVEVIVCLSDSAHCVLWSSLVAPSRWDSAIFDYCVFGGWEEGKTSPTIGLRVSDKCLSFGRIGADEASKCSIKSTDFERWVHLVGTFDGQTWWVFKDGEVVASCDVNPEELLSKDKKFKWKLGGTTQTESTAYLAMATLRVWQHPIHKSQVPALSERAHSGDTTIPAHLNSRGCVVFPLCEGTSNVVTCDSGIVDGKLSGKVVWAPTESVAVCPEDDFRTLDDTAAVQIGRSDHVSVPWVQWGVEAGATSRDSAGAYLCRMVTSACTLWSRQVILKTLGTLLSPVFRLRTGRQSDVPQLWPLNGNLPLLLAKHVRMTPSGVDSNSLDTVKSYMERLLKGYEKQSEREFVLFAYMLVQNCLLLLDDSEDSFAIDFVAASGHSTDSVLSPMFLPGLETCKLSFDGKSKSSLESITIYSDCTQKAQIARCPDAHGSWSDIDVQCGGWVFIRRAAMSHAISSSGQRITFKMKSPQFFVMTELLKHIFRVAASMPRLVPIVCSSIPVCSLIAQVHKQSSERRLAASEACTALFKLWAQYPTVNKHDQAPMYFTLDRIFGMLSSATAKDQMQSNVDLSPARLYSRFTQAMMDIVVQGHLTESIWFGTSSRHQARVRHSVLLRLYDSASPSAQPAGEVRPEPVDTSTAMKISTRSFGKWICTSERSWQVARCNVPLRRGRWYCEARVPSGGVMNLGIVSSRFHGSEHTTIMCPLGQCDASWCYDGVRLCRWHNGVKADYGARVKWKPRDIIGISLDLEEGTLSFHHNGKYLGTAYGDLPVHKNIDFYFAFGINAGHGAAEINFGRALLSHDVPQGYLPVDRRYFELPPSVPLYRLMALYEIAQCVQNGLPLPMFFQDLSESYFADKRAMREGSDVVGLVPLGDSRPKIENRYTVKSQTALSTTRADVSVTKGRWYYEITVTCEGVMSVGWCDEGFVGDAMRGRGVGDDVQSWGFDGHRVVLRHNKQQTAFSRRRWRDGDVVGCLVDMDQRLMQFSLNGELLKDSATESGGAPFVLSHGATKLFPVITQDPETVVVFAFATRDIQYLPDGYECMGHTCLLSDAITHHFFDMSQRGEVDVDETLSWASPSRTSWPLRSCLEDDANLVLFIDQLCEDRHIHPDHLDLEAVMAMLGVRENVPPALEHLIDAHNDSASSGVSKLARRFQLIRHINTYVMDLLPFFSSVLIGPVSASFRCLKPVLFASSTKSIVARYMRNSNGPGESLKITINRRRSNDKATSSVFSQIFSVLADKSPIMFWTSKRLWGVNLVGEGAEDAGGPYRESLSDICRDVMSTTHSLFIPTPNQTQNDGECRDRWLLNPRATGPEHLAMLTFLGRVIGGTWRGQDPLALYLPSMTWKMILGEKLMNEDLSNIDGALARALKFVLDADKQGLTAETFPDVYEGSFTVVGSDGVEVPLFPFGNDVTVSFDTRRDFVSLVQNHRMHVEGKAQHEALLSGFHSVVPRHAFALLRWTELERLICGRPDFNVEELMSQARFEGLRRSDRRVQFFETALKDFTPHERALFMRFVSGRERLPNGIRLKLMPAVVKSDAGPDQQLPGASTCFYWISLPDYSTVTIMREKLLFAITHCVDIDADFRVRDRDDDVGPSATLQDPNDDDDFEDYSHLL